MNIILTVFLKKLVIWGKWVILGLKVLHPHISLMEQHFDFWNVDKHEWKEQGVLMVFLKKIWAFLGPQMVHLHNSYCKQKKIFYIYISISLSLYI